MSMPMPEMSYPEAPQPAPMDCGIRCCGETGTMDGQQNDMMEP